MMIPYGKQEITKKDVDAVIKVLESDFLTQGPKVPEFEQAVANYCGGGHAVAVNSATSALHIACLALNLGTGDWLWTTPITFVASANCGLYCGAQIDFVDIDPHTYNICPSALADKLALANQQDRLPKVLVVVHMCGQSCEMDKIHSLTERYGIRIIEDASHAIGGEYQTEKIGSGRYSDITIFSFHPVKIITTGEGGMAITNNSGLADHMRLLRSHGVTRDSNQMAREPDGPWYYEQIDLGFNYRMTDLQAALGISQSKRLDEYVARRNDLADNYDQQLKNLPLHIPWQHPDSYSARHLYVIRLRPKEISKSQLEVFEELRSQGVGVNLHYIPVHTQPFYRNLGFKPGDYPKAESYYSTAISIPLHPGMTEHQQNTVIGAISRALTK